MVFKQSCPDPIAQILGTGFERFRTKFGVSGLAKESENGKRLEILAVNSDAQGCGYFRNFIDVCKQHYRTVCVWSIFNPIVSAALERYGFTPETEILGDGETVQGYRWDRI